ncbi:hypothetical protein FF38_08460 [Lucilia cuprina]|uniref:Uncharacterized protein n=1 Tax=Lucilia cuprina TaxID=7375 RepID=A0A0L0C8T1_LUCCU|nr:hypothetical protein FF38_08460 [Lucilia cuprina]
MKCPSCSISPICLTSISIVDFFKALPIITDFRQALEANIARIREGRHIVPSGASCSIKINSSISSLPNSQFLLKGLPSKRTLLVGAAKENVDLWNSQWLMLQLHRILQRFKIVLFIGSMLVDYKQRKRSNLVLRCLSLNKLSSASSLKGVTFLHSIRSTTYEAGNGGDVLLINSSYSTDSFEIISKLGLLMLFESDSDL